MGHATFVWRSEPNGFEYEHTLNLYGFRDDEWRRTSSGVRVAFVGDSFVEGYGASDRETIPRLFERAVCCGIHVHNLGIGGANLPQYFALIRDYVS